MNRNAPKNPTTAETVALDDAKDLSSGERLRSPRSGSLELELDRATPERPVSLGDYEVLRRVGAGAMGVVYEGRDARGGRVALKILRRAGGHYLARLKDEFRALAGVSHANLVPIFELVVPEGGAAFLAMGFVSGDDLSTLLGSRGTYGGDTVATQAPSEVHAIARANESPSETSNEQTRTEEAELDRLREILLGVANGIDALHAKGKLHRDLKPSNVLVDRSGRPVVVDFGLAIDQSEQAEPGIIGTPAYMAPEQARAQAAEPASDWYAFGVILYQALAGRLPFAGSRAEVLSKKQTETPPWPSRVASDVPPDLESLAMALLAIDPAGRPSGAEILRALGGVPREAHTGRGAFVGRADVLASLSDAFLRTTEGACVVRWIQGESGVGKSATVGRFLDELRVHPAAPLVLSGRCHACESVPYKAFDDVIRELASTLARESKVVVAQPMGGAVAMFPVLDAVTGAGGRDGSEDGVDRAERRARGARQLKTLLSRVSASRPLVIVADDLQWADADSAHLLAELLAPPDAPRLLFIGMVRSEEMERAEFMREANRRLPRAHLAHDTVIRVERLSDADAIALAETYLDAEARGSAPEIARSARGNPFLLEELVRHMRGGGGAPSHATIEGLLDARIAELHREPRQILEILSVAGDTIELGPTLRAAGVHEGGIEALKLLEARSFISLGGLRDDDDLRVYHDRVRETVLRSMRVEIQGERHLALALALDVPEASPEVLARHFIAGGETARGARLALEAGARSARAFAFEHAADLFQSALDTGALSDAERRNARLSRADALTNGGRTAEAARIYDEEASRGPASEAPDLKRRAAEQFLVAGRVDEGSRLLEDVVRLSGMKWPASPAKAWLTTTGGLGLTLLRPRARDGGAVSAEASFRLRTMFTAARGLSAFDMMQGAFFTLETLRLSLRAGDRMSTARSMAAVGSVLAYGGAAPLVRAGEGLISRAMKLVDRDREAELYASLEIQSGITKIASGDWRGAIEVLVPALDRLHTRCAGYQHERAYGEMTAILALESLGRLREIRARAERANREGQSTGNLYLRVQANLYLALSSIAEGRDGDSVEHERALLDWPAKERGFLFQHWLGLKVRVMRLLHSGDARSALEEMTRAWPELERSKLLGLAFIRTAALTLRAAAALGAREDPAKTLKDADALVRSSFPPARPAGLALRGVAERRGQAQASRDLEESQRLFESLGMKLHAASVARTRGVLAADAELLAEGVAHPARWAAVLIGAPMDV